MGETTCGCYTLLSHEKRKPCFTSANDPDFPFVEIFLFLRLLNYVESNVKENLTENVLK